MEGDREHVALADGDRVPVHAASTSTPSPRSSTHGARMKTARTGPPATPAMSRSASNERTWRPNALRRRAMSMHAEVVAVEHDHARRTCRTPACPARQLAQRLGEALALDPERHRRRLAAGDHQPVEPVEVGGHAHLARVGAELAQHRRVRREVALQGEDADSHA